MALTLDQYQKRARETAIYDEQYNFVYPTLGLVGEAGEVAEKVKKALRDNGGEFTPEIRSEIAKELGDVLWYVANLASDLGFSLEAIGNHNMRKLKSRQERGKLSGSGDER